MNQTLPLSKNQIISLFLILPLLFSLFVGMVLVRQRQDIRPKAAASSVTLSLLPNAKNLALNETVTYDLIATFTGGSATEKIDYLKTEILFSNQYLSVPPEHYVRTLTSGLKRVIRVDGPTVATQNGKIIIRLAASEPGNGPATNQAIVIAKIDFKGIKRTPQIEDISIGATQVVNNQSAEIPVATIAARYTVDNPIPITPYTTPILPPAPLLVLGQANFLLSTDQNSASVGQNIKVTVSLHLTNPAAKVSGVDFLLLYDKNKLDVGNIVPNVTSTDPAAPFTEAPIVSPGGYFDETFNFIRVALVANRSTENLPSGTIKLAEITFRGRAEGSATIKFPDDNKYLEVVGVGSPGPTSITGSPPASTPTSSPTVAVTVTPGGPSPTPPQRSWNSGACRTWCRGQGATAATCESACVNYDSCMSNCRTVASESQCSGVCNGFYTN